MALLTFAIKKIDVNKLHPSVKSLFKWHPTYSAHSENEKVLEQKEVKPSQQELLEEEKQQIDEEWRNLELEKQELAHRVSQLEQKQLDLETWEKELGVLQDKLETKLQNIKDLAQYYELMETRNAAKILENTDDDFIIQLFSQMKKETASEILSNLDPKKAAAITKKMGGV